MFEFFCHGSASSHLLGIVLQRCFRSIASSRVALIKTNRYQYQDIRTPIWFGGTLYWLGIKDINEKKQKRSSRIVENLKNYWNPINCKTQENCHGIKNVMKFFFKKRLQKIIKNEGVSCILNWIFDHTPFLLSVHACPWHDGCSNCSMYRSLSGKCQFTPDMYCLFKLRLQRRWFNFASNNITWLEVLH